MRICWIYSNFTLDSSVRLGICWHYWGLVFLQNASRYTNVVYNSNKIHFVFFQFQTFLFQNKHIFLLFHFTESSFSVIDMDLIHIWKKIKLSKSSYKIYKNVCTIWERNKPTSLAHLKQYSKNTSYSQLPHFVYYKLHCLRIFEQFIMLFCMYNLWIRYINISCSFKTILKEQEKEQELFSTPTFCLLQVVQCLSSHLWTVHYAFLYKYAGLSE